ncbi:LTA synthase family protein [Orbus sturtevantii]|uniref:LTA synthase family protein n=1 Tax=Orbus sturtevantii TaxID=3074109 RepID=UPI00370D1783
MLALLPINAWISLPLLLISISLASFVHGKRAKLLIIILMTLLLVTELISIYFSGGFVDYQFYVNLNANDIIEGLAIFKLQAAFAIVAFFVFLFVQFKLAVVLQKCKIFLRLAILVVAILSLNYEHGPVEKLFEIYQVTSSPKLTFTQSLEKLNITDYPTKEQIEALSGKNIIVISLESFEQGFLDFNDITPNLNKLTQKYSFYPNIPMGMGSSWTTASMYTYMTGMPLLVGGSNTTPLSDITKTNLVSLGDVLNKGGYQARYIIGSPTFAGIGHIISLFGIDVICEKNYPDQYPDAPFGLYDRDTFDIAKRQINELAASDKPFALFISTISTHAPDGFHDARMEPLISKKDNSMSFAAASLDYNLNRFIEYLDKQGMLKNTVFYIFPDHLMMGAGTQTIANLSQRERFLYLLTNANSTDLAMDVKSTIYQIDLPRIILDGAGIKTNARFLTDYLDHTIDKKQFIIDHKSAIATINRSAGTQ